MAGWGRPGFAPGGELSFQPCIFRKEYAGIWRCLFLFQSCRKNMPGAWKDSLLGGDLRGLSAADFCLP